MAAPLSTSAPQLRVQLVRALKWLVRPQRIAFAIAGAAVASGLATYMALAQKGPFQTPAPDLIVGLLILDLVLGLLTTAIVAWQVAHLMVARRAHSAGAQLHRQLFVQFSLVAVAPAILVAVFSVVTLNMGIEAWFNKRVQTALESAVKAADAYVEAHKQSIKVDIINLNDTLSTVAPEIRADRTRFIDYVRASGALQGLHAIQILDAQGRNILRVTLVPDMEMADPDPQQMKSLTPGEYLYYTDENADQARALLRVRWPEGGFIYIGRKVNPEVLGYKRETRAAFDSYTRLQKNRFTLEITFALVYFIVSLLILLCAVWLGLSFANRIVQPIGHLISAAERVSNGDLSARVDVGRTRDEIEGLGRAFNRMTGQLQSQRNELIEANRQVDDRRRFTEAVLSGVSAGVIGLDQQGLVTVANRSALRLLGLDRAQIIGRPLSKVVPAFANLFMQAQTGGRARDQIDFEREDGARRLNVQIAADIGQESGGLVVTFDDITELAAAQRTAAWADVARRIAHEIKNPLTPIQLSAERLRRKYKKEVVSDPEIFDQCTETIIRHVNDIGRMVDEFSSFARMPEPVFHEHDLVDLVRQSIFLQKVAFPDIEFKAELPGEKVIAACDARLISQALVNVMKNSGEAIAQRHQDDPNAPKGEITVRVKAEPDHAATIEVADNGGGWPKSLRSRLTEPYVTTRKKGTGLGLAIVRKIVEDHRGRLILADLLSDGRIVDDAAGGEVVGAVIKIVLPLQDEAKQEVTNRTPASAHA
ncbi:MAG: PAS domain-containing sensor histidine kinase [Alphaproteobacteria bacterium]